MTFCTADYVIVAVAFLTGVFGLFNGFSGALAFLTASTAGSLAGRVAWTFSDGRFASGWTRGLVVLVAAILVFGIVRWSVRKIVSGLLRQPADAIFGFLVAALTGCALSVAAIYAANVSGFLAIESSLLSRIQDLTGVAATSGADAEV